MSRLSERPTPMRASPANTRVLRLAGLLACFCAWFALPTASPARADNHVLEINHMVKGENFGKDAEASYTVMVDSGEQIVVAAINADALSRLNAPEVEVTCPRSDGRNLRKPDDGKNRDGAVYCRPLSADGSQVAVTVNVKSRSNQPMTYALFVQQLNQAGAMQFTDAIRSGQSLQARRIAAYNIENRRSDLGRFRLDFTVPPPSNRAFAMLYREDGDQQCAFRDADLCDTFDRNYPYYTLVIMNTGDTPFTYDLVFTRS